MKKISSDFTTKKYGISVRLVVERDAQFIVDLRTNKSLSRFIHSTDDNIQKQIEWIRQYKERESRGEEYYFIFYIDKIPYGVERIYNIKEDSFVHGSLVFKEESPFGASIKADIITREIGFGMLEKETNYFDVSKGNNGVISYHERYKPVILSEDEESYHYSLSKENFEKYKSVYMKIFKMN